MTDKAVAQILTMIERYYPERAGSASRDTIAAWVLVLQDIPDAAGIAAAIQYFKHNRYPPHVSDIVNGVEAMTDAATDTGIEKYWRESWRAVCGDLKFKDLSDVSKAYWKSQQAIDAAGTSEKTIESVLKGQFLRVVPDIIKRLKVKKETPPAIAAALAGTDPAPVDTRRENLLALETAIQNDAAQLPEQTDAEKQERRARWLAAIGCNTNK